MPETCKLIHLLGCGYHQGGQLAVHRHTLPLTNIYDDRKLVIGVGIHWLPKCNFRHAKWRNLPQLFQACRISSHANLGYHISCPKSVNASSSVKPYKSHCIRQSHNACQQYRTQKPCTLAHQRTDQFDTQGVFTRLCIKAATTKACYHRRGCAVAQKLLSVMAVTEKLRICGDTDVHAISGDVKSHCCHLLCLFAQGLNL